jgi:hypothetical protein
VAGASTSYVCNGNGGVPNVLDGNGSVLGQFVSAFNVGNPGSQIDVAYRDSNGTIIPRRGGDGTLDPTVGGGIGYSMALCQGTPYLINDGARVPVDFLIVNGTSGYYYKALAIPPATITLASQLQPTGTCNADTRTLSNVYTAVQVTGVPMTVAGPLKIQ